jgi:hypothetical protein
VANCKVMAYCMGEMANGELRMANGE